MRGSTTLTRPSLRHASIIVAAFAALACAESEPLFDAKNPAAGPGAMVGAEAAWNDLAARPFGGGDDVVPARRAVNPPLGPAAPDCDAACRQHCDGAALDNPVNLGICESLWGVGLDTQPIDIAEACRRVYADTLGRFPTLAEVQSTCLSKPWTDVVSTLLASEEFVNTNQRRWADRLLYNNEALSPIRIYDADLLVAKLYKGLVAYDEFATVISAHPVLTRRYATSGDRAEALFRMFLGRPPYERERADLARLYVLWDNHYYDHPSFGRVPDAFIRFQCLTDEGERNPETAGECASVLWGYRELVLTPDVRVRDERLWAGVLSPKEWQRMQEPGRIVASEPAFWERAIDDVLDQYLGYRLSSAVPAVRENLVDYLLQYGADIRAVHFAILTSAPYLQSARSPEDPIAVTYRYTWGPLKQAEVETWIDTIENVTTTDLGACDFRLPDPWRVMDGDTIGSYALIENSDWRLRGENGDEIDTRYLELARSLGGCPENLAGGRFKTVSILTTATQEGFVTAMCNPAMLDERRDAPIEALLPGGMAPQLQLTSDVASQILIHQAGTFFAREPAPDESLAVIQAADECAPKPCTAEQFARPLCFSLLSSAEMLFY